MYIVNPQDVGNSLQYFLNLFDSKALFQGALCRASVLRTCFGGCGCTVHCLPLQGDDENDQLLLRHEGWLVQGVKEVSSSPLERVASSLPFFTHRGRGAHYL